MSFKTVKPVLAVGVGFALLALLVSCSSQTKPSAGKGPAAEGAAPAKVELVNSIGMKLVLIPAGKFIMGSPPDEEARDYWDEGPQHEVDITKPFYMGIYEVTQEEYYKVTGANPCYFSITGEGKEKVKGLDTSSFPVETVSWEDAVEFCRKLSEMSEENRAGRTYRLPTEAEWEYACRAGTTTVFHHGNSLSSTQANFKGNDPYGGAAQGPFLRSPSPVGSYQPNGFGLYDMHGNVWEWCADWYDDNYFNTSPKQDPENTKRAGYRVFRGGGWDGNGWYCRSADRCRVGPGDRGSGLGFRVVAVQSGR